MPDHEVVARLGHPWRVLRTALFVAAVAILGALLTGSSLSPTGAWLILGGFIALLVLWTFVHNLRIAAAERLVHDEVGDEVQTVAAGVLAPAYVWNGMNGAAIAVGASTLLVVSITIQPPRVLARGTVTKCTVETQPGKLGTTLDVETPEGRVALRTAASMAADVVYAVRFQETPA